MLLLKAGAAEAAEAANKPAAKLVCMVNADPLLAKHLLPATLPPSVGGDDLSWPSHS